jgi:hypothetical protein
MWLQIFAEEFCDNVFWGYEANTTFKFHFTEIKSSKQFKVHIPKNLHQAFFHL